VTIRAAVLTSTAPRHRYFHQVMARQFDLHLALAQAKGSYYQAQREESEMVRRHFARVEAAETAEFCARLDTSLPTIREVPDINDPGLVRAAKEAGVELVLLYGTAILKDLWLDAFPNRIVNLHLGLSPFYRGSATLFWPFAQNELECLGTTIHLAVAKVDAGPILGRIKPKFVVGDTYYTITNRLIRESIDAVPSIASRYLSGGLVPVQQILTGARAWRKADFSEEALQRALSVVGEGMTEEQIRRIEASDKCRCSR
jgi:folate-dependent phosphoribosylglycinamide formyltransferase PurN